MSSSPVKLTHQETPLQTHHPKPKTQPNSSHSKSGRAASPRPPATAHASSSQTVESSGKENTAPKRKLDRSTSNLQNMESSNRPEKKSKMLKTKKERKEPKTTKAPTEGSKKISNAQKRREEVGIQDDYNGLGLVLHKYYRNENDRIKGTNVWLLTEPSKGDNDNREETEYEERRCIVSAIKITMNLLEKPLRNYDLSKEQCSKFLGKPEVPEDFYKNALRMISKGAPLLKDKDKRKWSTKDTKEKVTKAITFLNKRIQ
ncbi:hypothetical protein PNOK_0838900 [Pyrrhoderma noxium]|uniref:Uncharacterized protein n=1 Tax=Pyrrhoderma noxium TaxID=2282107 RepID=A0A286UB28_9AGAM|nr:hypothetical protein PNOK_0838900 [Pyrrhoderma noxium]